MTHNDEIIPNVNPSIILREEFDNWAILFDPDSNVAFGINPIGIYVWKCLNGQSTIKDIIEKLRKELIDVPGDIGIDLKEFIDDLVNRGLAYYTNL
jgi:SynChlorMet cassette protein ScmD